MKFNSLSPTLASVGFLLLTPTFGHTQNTNFSHPYMGIALSWDHLGGKHYESLSNFAGSNLIFSQGRSLSTNRFNGYLFLGTFFKLQQNWFISPEWQIGQGTLDRQLENTSRDPDILYIERHLNPKLSRKMTTSLVLRVGSNLTQPIQLYALTGVDASLFKYKTIYENVDFGLGPGLGFKTFTRSKWKFAPIIGIGIVKNFDKAHIGIEYRLTSYRGLKMNRIVYTQDSVETISSKMKPRISSLMLRWSYSL
jgi:hypothetical protein